MPTIDPPVQIVDHSADGTIIRALKLLDLFSTETPDLGLTQLATMAGLPKSTAQRLLRSLEQVGMVQQDRISRRWRLGLRLLELSGRVEVGLAIRDAGEPEVSRLQRLSEETVSLHIAVGDYGVCVVHKESTQPLRMSITHGSQVPLNLGAGRLAILAAMPDEAVERYVTSGNRAKMTGKSLVDANEIRAFVEEIRSRGYALTEGHHTDGAVGLAVGVAVPSIDLYAGLCVTGPNTRFTQAKAVALAPEMTLSARRIESRLLSCGDASSPVEVR